uniref:C2H2-type domain-containing protein n=1 Tax=Timema bartmani TaxID=61472 RepID=A0A7R9F5P1_9NEOP|nr:unnamed protein product [Timema bartmani]
MCIESDKKLQTVVNKMESKQEILEQIIPVMGVETIERSSTKRQTYLRKAKLNIKVTPMRHSHGTGSSSVSSTDSQNSDENDKHTAAEDIEFSPPKFRIHKKQKQTRKTLKSAQLKRYCRKFQFGKQQQKMRKKDDLNVVLNKDNVDDLCRPETSSENVYQLKDDSNHLCSLKADASNNPVSENQDLTLQSDFVGDCTRSKQTSKERETIGKYDGKCPKKFAQRIDLVRHSSTHSVQKGYQCSICEKWYANKKRLVLHLGHHTEDRSYRCELCGMTFSQIKYLVQHVDTHTRSESYTCDICGHSCSCREKITLHIRGHMNNPYDDIQQHECPLCDKAFCHASGLSRHLLSHTGKTYDCVYCNKKFSDRSTLKRHAIKHSNTEETD